MVAIPAGLGGLGLGLGLGLWLGSRSGIGSGSGWGFRSRLAWATSRSRIVRWGRRVVEARTAASPCLRALTLSALTAKGLHSIWRTRVSAPLSSPSLRAWARLEKVPALAYSRASTPRLRRLSSRRDCALRALLVVSTARAKASYDARRSAVAASYAARSASASVSEMVTHSTGGSCSWLATMGSALVRLRRWADRRARIRGSAVALARRSYAACTSWLKAWLGLGSGLGLGLGLTLELRSGSGLGLELVEGLRVGERPHVQKGEQALQLR